MKRNIIYAIICAAFAASCAEENNLHPYGDNDKQAPGKVSEVTVRNMPGAAVIKYQVPADDDLLYVKAVYQSTRGEEREVRSSGYVDSLYIEGFGDTRTYPVTLYAVDRHENISEGTVTFIQPETPPVVHIRGSLEYIMDFGGFLVNFENDLKNDIAIYALRWDEEEGDYVYYDAMYTSQQEGHFSVRGLPNVETKFGVYVRDRYDNQSDTLFFTGTPIKEDYLNKKLFKEQKCAGDANWNNYNGALFKLWDEQPFTPNSGNHAHTPAVIEFPHRFTIDLGVKVKLSRMKEWQRSKWEYNSIKRFRVYGCVELPRNTEDNPLEGWTLLGEFISVKPSGLPLEQLSTEDEEMYLAGEEFIFKQPIPVIRYFKLESLESYSGVKSSALAELSFWGDIVEEIR